MSAKTLRNLLTAFVVLVLGLGAAGLLVKLGKKPERMVPPPSRPLVSAYTIAPDNDAVRVKSFGSVKAKRSVDVVSRVAGEVVHKSRHFEAGGYFARGDILLKIDDTDYVLAAEQARAKVAQSEYQLAQSSSARARWAVAAAVHASRAVPKAAQKASPTVLNT